MIAKYVVSLLAALAASTVLTPDAGAQTRVVETRADTVEYTGPDRTLLKSGAWTLGLSYVPALVVGIESSLPADRYLLAPVAGPWIDLARRDCPDCTHEGWNKALLVTDGVIQGIGALQILGSFLFVEHTVVSRTARSQKKQARLPIHVVPRFTSMSNYGLTAVGEF